MTCAVQPMKVKDVYENRIDMTMYGQMEVENSNDVQIVILDVQDWIRRWKNWSDVGNFVFQISCGLGLVRSLLTGRNLKEDRFLGEW